MHDETAEYLRIDEKENAIDSLGRALAFLSEVEQNPFNWKWFVISFHHATYSFMLLALQNPDLSGIWREPEIREKDDLIDVFNPKNKLISFIEAFKRIQDKNRMGGYINSKPFVAEKSHKDSMRKLNNHLRNEFVHFRHTSLSIHKKYIVKYSLPVLEIIKFLVFESGRVKFDNGQSKRIAIYLDAINSILRNYAT